MLEGAGSLADVSVLRWRLAAGAVLVGLLYLGFRARADVAEEMGFDDADVALVTVGALAAPVLSVPVALVDGTVFAVNLGGALVPLIVAWRLFHKGHLPLHLALAGAVPVAVATFYVVDVEPGVGVSAPFPAFLVPPLVALAVGLLAGRARPSRAGPIALASGSLGALVGADLANLPVVLAMAERAPPGTALVVGGGGSFDLVFLAGALGLALSLGLALVTTEQGTRPLGERARPPLRVPKPEPLLDELERLPGWTPRERALASLARANFALAGDRHSEAVQEARRAVSALVTAGSPKIGERVREGEASRELRDELTAFDELAQPDGADYERAARSVEEAKHVTARLWQHAPGRVRAERWSR